MSGSAAEKASIIWHNALCLRAAWPWHPKGLSFPRMCTKGSAQAGGGQSAPTDSTDKLQQQRNPTSTQPPGTYSADGRQSHTFPHWEAWEPKPLVLPQVRHWACHVPVTMECGRLSIILSASAIPSLNSHQRVGLSFSIFSFQQ